MQTTIRRLCWSSDADDDLSWSPSCYLTGRCVLLTLARSPVLSLAGCAALLRSIFRSRPMLLRHTCLFTCAACGASAPWHTLMNSHNNKLFAVASCLSFHQTITTTYRPISFVIYKIQIVQEKYMKKVIAAPRSKCHCHFLVDLFVNLFGSML